MNESDVIQNIKKYGFHIVKVLEEEELPAFVYTVGFNKIYNHPEVIISGLSLDIAETILNDIANNIKQGTTYTSNCEYEDIIQNYKCFFLEVDKKKYNNYLGRAIWFYQNSNFETLQCVWPDRNRKYPWQVEFGPNLISKQEILGDATKLV